MRQLVLSFAMLALAFVAHSQWSYKTIDNGLDTAYRIAYCDASASTYRNNNIFVKLENVEGEIALYVSGTYTCDVEPIVEMAFLVNGAYKKYTFTGLTSTSHKTVFIITDMMSNQSFVDDFKASSLMKVRVNDEDCGEETHEFKMTSSSAALTYMLAQ
jgi:hypothetical protein